MWRCITATMTVAGLLAIGGSAQAGITAISLGTDAPPADLAGVRMQPFPPDPAPIFADVISAPGPMGPVGFSQELNHRRVGMGWGTWSHGYTGDVYDTVVLDAVALILPHDTRAFYLYAEPGPFQPYLIAATAYDQFGDSVTLEQIVHGMAGAKGYAFVADECSKIMSILVVEDSISSHFAVGEFGIAQAPAGPTVVAHPADQVVDVGSSATFTVAAAGSGAVTYQWRLGGAPLPESDAMYGTTTDTLTVNPVEQSSAGIYDVVVSDACGSTVSDGALLELAASGDLDHDGDVDGLDLAILLGAWGPCPQDKDCPADLDGNGVVNGMDLAILLGAWR